MRLVVIIAFLFSLITNGQASQVILASSDHAQTFAYGEMIWHQLSTDPVSQVLTARITFSNLPYVGSHDPRVDEAFDFRFPGTQVDRRTQRIFVRDRHGKAITVATFHGNPTTGWVDLTPEAKVYLLKESGRVAAVLTATSDPRSGMRWIQKNDNWSLQNLIARLFCTR